MNPLQELKKHIDELEAKEQSLEMILPISNQINRYLTTLAVYRDKLQALHQLLWKLRKGCEVIEENYCRVSAWISYLHETTDDRCEDPSRIKLHLDKWNEDLIEEMPTVKDIMTSLQEWVDVLRTIRKLYTAMPQQERKLVQAPNDVARSIFGEKSIFGSEMKIH